MREILFRGKTIDNPRWVEGYFAEADLYLNGNIVRHPVIVDKDDDMKEINPETLCEFTGLYDSKGNKVFEGDILSFAYDVLGGEWKGRIVFGNPHSRYTWGWEIVPITPTDFNIDILLWFDMEETGAICEVIGNIYDNPELLE